MCRLAAYIGPSRPLADVVVAPKHSLLVQSQEASEAKLAVNGDGFGFAWYSGATAEPGLYKDVLPAWSDANLLSLCKHIASPLFMAHVRASTEAETARANCHPFTWRNWSFMHNGQVGNFGALRRPLENSLSDELYALRQGRTDSELLFLMLIQEGLAHDPATATDAVLERLNNAAQDTGEKPFLRLTCVFSDGEGLYAFRHASDGRCPSLYTARGPNGTVLASEPLDDNFGHWETVPPDTLIHLKAGGYRTLTSLTGTGVALRPHVA